MRVRDFERSRERFLDYVAVADCGWLEESVFDEKLTNDELVDWLYRLGLPLSVWVTGVMYEYMLEGRAPFSERVHEERHDDD